MPKHAKPLKLGQIRKHNTVLRNWANSCQSDNLAKLLLSGVIRVGVGRSGKVILKGAK